MSAPTKVTQKCKTCGGNLVFNPSQNGLVCQRCGNFVPVSGTVTNEKSFQELLNNAPKWQKDTIIFRCEHCGAKSVVSKFDLVAKCDYCGAANMVKTKEAPGLRPDTVVLFEVNRDTAFEKMSNWLSKRFFAPASFKRQLKNRQLNGIYYPAFTFDANVTARYSGVLVHTDSTTIVVDGQETTQTQTIRRGIHDTDTQIFDDVLVLASDEITPKTLAEIQPFDTNRGQVFQQSYLSGFTVSGAMCNPQECWQEAKKTMEGIIRNKITTRYSRDGATLEGLQLDLSFTNITYKYVLLPIYVGNTTYQGVKYPFYMNGKTGKIYAKTPKSWWKILLTFAGMGVLAFGLGIVLAILF